MEEDRELLLINILTQQQNVPGQAGIRLSLHPSLTRPLQPVKQPFAFCAATGNIPLALHLYQLGLPGAGAAILVALLSSGGVAGDSPWNKPVSLTPADIARMSGHSKMGRLLELMEARVPLTWSPSKHSSYPRAFKRRARCVMEAVCSSAWFIGLPGPARVTITQYVMKDLARTHVWGLVSDQDLLDSQGPFGSRLDDLVSSLAQQHSKQIDSAKQSPPPFSQRPRRRTQQAQDSTAQHAQDNPFSPDWQPQDDLDEAAGTHAAHQHAPGFQDHDLDADHPEANNGFMRHWSFRVAYFTPSRWAGMGVARTVLQGALSLALCAVTLRCRKREPTPLIVPYLAGTCAGMGMILPGAALLLAQLLSGEHSS